MLTLCFLLYYIYYIVRVVEIDYFILLQKWTSVSTIFWKWNWYSRNCNILKKLGLSATGTFTLTLKLIETQQKFFSKLKEHKRFMGKIAHLKKSSCIMKLILNIVKIIQILKHVFSRIWQNTKIDKKKYNLLIFLF